ncbi:unnamed protein product, partial [Vitis vinifera]
MAASVDNRQFSRLESSLNGVVRSFKTGSNHRSDSPVRGAVEDDSSSDDENEPDWKDLVRKGNSELEPSAPLNRLMHHGFITPVPLHYVRNHGAVPKGSWDNWTVEVSGLVKRPARFTMDQLVNEFPTREFPVTLVCAGNRRKEQNMQGGLNVCFEGAEDLPGGGGSKYGTSIKNEIAMDPSRDIILAYMQNGERLLPDHGFPVRMIIPGFIGGRMVKWLKRIIVTTQESDSYYHYKDNRVLPSHVDAELANAEAWWYKPEYIINELNINSVITTPCHEEILPINSWTTQRPYTLKGYAYSGGGKKVTRVEVTMDGGETWQVCRLDHPEKPNKYGKYWCWCFWSLEVEVLDLIGAKEIAVRAWDETLNTQPEKLIWNVMGMMNNCWFRVKTNVCKRHRGEIGIVFEHPTLPGNQSGGWMAREKHLVQSSDANSTLKKSVSSPFMNTSSKMYSMSEVKKHNSADSTWIVVHGHVYDCTRFLKDHPGGTDSILINAGTDCTEEFDAIHSDKAKKLLEDYRIGELMTTGYTSDSSASSPNTSKIPCKLVSKDSISHDVRRFRFALPSEDQIIQAVLKDPEDDTEMYVVYANRTEDDILLWEELDAWAEKHERLKVLGFITESILREHIPSASGDTLALACGPPPMIQFAVQPNLEKLGYDIKNSLLVF